MQTNISTLEQLFRQWAGEAVERKALLAANGSNRQYWRLESQTRHCVATVAGDVRENEAFFYFAKELKARGVRVPEVYAISQGRTTYLQQDLGDATVYSYLQSKKNLGIDVDREAGELYRRAMDDLLEMQDMARDVDFMHSYPRPDMDRQSFQWDLNYFKYDFLKLLHTPFDEEFLEKDFGKLIDYLLEGDNRFFLHRDFQTRNIMLEPASGDLYYIDFQGCRRGSPFYDVASLLYSSRCELDYDQREALLEYFLDKFTSRHNIATRSRKVMRHRYYSYVLVRMLQAMGAYGYRGIFERKDYFLRAIPMAMDTLRHVREKHPLPLQLPELDRVLDRILAMPEFIRDEEKLTVRIFSFSYKKGTPADKSGNGGGYAFDCRALPNPGRYEQYKELCGKDMPVIQFLESHAEINEFFGHAASLVEQSVDNYVARGFSSLMVCFGCTGGRHRSVYFAERMASRLRGRRDIRVVLKHCEQETFKDNV
ncbi:MAG: RNase adapter RapZ [Bacteroidales bacterium]|nr:RNase adapter RapZ [Bacteroidales bacterium]